MQATITQQAPSQPSISVQFIGVQEGGGLVRDFPLYNTCQPVGDLPAGATLSPRTLRLLGWQVPADTLVIVRAHPCGGWTHAWLEWPGTTSCRVYRGHWSTEQAAATALAGLNLE